MDPPNYANGGSAVSGAASARSIRDVSGHRLARWQDARLIEIIVETSDAVTLRLRLDDSADFLPGQYYNVRLSVPGRTGLVQRAYSVASSPIPDASTIDIGVR